MATEADQVARELPLELTVIKTSATVPCLLCLLLFGSLLLILRSLRLAPPPSMGVDA